LSLRIGLLVDLRDAATQILQAQSESIKQTAKAPRDLMALRQPRRWRGNLATGNCLILRVPSRRIAQLPRDIGGPGT
jgi:hypothetical protein